MSFSVFSPELGEKQRPWMPDQAGHDKESRAGAKPRIVLPLLQSLSFRAPILLLSSLIGNPVSCLYLCPGACGRGCAPVPKIPFQGEDCLSEASSAAGSDNPSKRDWGKGIRRTTPGRQSSFCHSRKILAGIQCLCSWELGKSNDPGCPIKPGMTSCGGETPHSLSPLCIPPYTSLRTPAYPSKTGMVIHTGMIIPDNEPDGQRAA